MSETEVQALDDQKQDSDDQKQASDDQKQASDDQKQASDDQKQASDDQEKSPDDLTESAVHDFDFYLKFVKRLVLKLCNPNERVLAAAWVKKLKDESTASEAIRIEYLKLFLFVLHKGQLTGPFLKNPNEQELEDVTEENILDIANKILKRDFEDRIERKVKVGFWDNLLPHPPYSIVSSDNNNTTEYAATQHIPRFGVQGYFAISHEPVKLWDKSEASKYSTPAPKEKGGQVKKEDISQQQSAKKNLFRKEQDQPTPTPKRAESRIVEMLGMVPEKDVQSRITWGSNLIWVHNMKARHAPYPKFN